AADDEGEHTDREGEGAVGAAAAVAAAAAVEGVEVARWARGAVFDVDLDGDGEGAAGVLGVGDGDGDFVVARGRVGVDADADGAVAADLGHAVGGRRGDGEAVGVARGVVDVDLCVAAVAAHGDDRIGVWLGAAGDGDAGGGLEPVDD